jgi:Uma2 family endonuclease
MSMHQSSQPRRQQPGPIVLRYELPSFSERWTIPEETVPESAWHDACVELVKALLAAWIARSARSAAVYRNMAIRVRQDRPQVGFDPDVCVVEPAPLEGAELESLQLWRPEHAPPALVIEVVSPSHPFKDYAEIPEKCAASGVGELVVFDPKLCGPRTGGGPHLLQLWRRTADAHFTRVHAGNGPALSDVLGAWWLPVERARRLRITDDVDGTRLWPTAEEEALRRVAELEAELKRRDRETS